jgi:hypothetical protein
MALHINDHAALHQRQRECANGGERERSEDIILARPAADEAVDAAAAPVPVVEHRAQHLVGKQPEVVTLVDQQRVFARSQQVIDHGCGDVAAPIGVAMVLPQPFTGESKASRGVTMKRP